MRRFHTRALHIQVRYLRDELGCSVMFGRGRSALVHDDVTMRQRLEEAHDVHHDRLLVGVVNVDVCKHSRSLYDKLIYIDYSQIRMT